MLNLNFSTFNTPPSPSPKTLCVILTSNNNNQMKHLMLLITLLPAISIGQTNRSQVGLSPSNRATNISTDSTRNFKNIEMITLECRPALKSHSIIISLTNYANKITIRKDSYHADLKGYTTDTTIKLEKIDFNSLKQKFYKCLTIDLQKTNLMVLDGYIYSISYQSGSGSTSIQFNLPSKDKVRRGLVEFVELRDLLIDLTGVEIPKE